MSRFTASLLTAALAATLAAVVVLPSGAQPAKPAGKKIALLVGVNEYSNRRLPNLQYAERDMTDLAEVLRNAGFEVRLLLGSSKGNDEATRPNIDRAVDDVLKGVGKRDTVLFALSGHGQQFAVKDKEEPFFCGKDAAPTDPATLVSLSAVLRKLDDKGGGTNLLLVDACRTDPDPNKGTRGGIDGSRVESLGEGTAVFFACSKRQKARETDKAGGGHGVFFYHVLEGLKGAAEATNGKGDVTWERLVPYVKSRVQDDFPTWFPNLDDDERQRPHAIGNLVEDPILVSKGSSAPAKTYVSTATGMKFVLIPRGKFKMGSPKEEKDRFDNEELHDVEITKPFYLGTYAVTRGQFRKFVDDSGYKTDAETDGKGGYGVDQDSGTFKQDPKYTWRDPGFEQSDEHPVVNVSWNDAKAFCEWLSRKDRKKWGLPTESQWEYACRAGSQTRFHFGDDEEDLAKFGNVADASLKKQFPQFSAIKADDGYVFTAPVGKFKANAFGLCDMHGNVWQWCEDYYDAKYYANSPIKDPCNDKKPNEERRVLRGGSWGSGAWVCRAAARSRGAPADRIGNVGFRVCVRLD